MTAVGYWFESGPLHMTQEYSATTNIDWITDVTAGKIKGILTNTSPDTHHSDWDHYDDVSGELTTGNGYTVGGKALTTPTVGLVTDTYRYIRYDADDLTWTVFTAGPARYLIVYKDTGTASTSPLICYHDFGAARTGNGGDFTYQFSALGGVCRSKIPHA